MHGSILCRMRFILLMASLMGFWGCATMMETMPAPPDFSSGSQLSGPFDKDIPSRHVNAIKNARLVLDEAVPYIYVRVGMHFESIGDGERSIHFYDRAIDEFRERNNTPGEGTAYSRKISALIRFGNTQMAYSAIQELEKKWGGSPLKAFVFYNIGYYHLKKGDYAEARKCYAQALAANSDQEDNPDLLALRRDAEFEIGRVLILADYFPAVSEKLCLQDLDEFFYQSIRRNIAEGLVHLEQVDALNKTLQKTRVSAYFPEIAPRSMECDVYNLRGLAYGIAGKREEALKNLKKAGSISRRSDYHLGEADNIFFLNQIYLLEKNRSEGIQKAQALAEIADRYQLVAYSFWANLILAHHYRGTGDTEKTMHTMEKALTMLEDYGSWLFCNVDFRGIRFLQRPVPYETLLNLHAAKGDERGAFKAAERSKAALLADRLAGEVVGKSSDNTENVKKIHLSRQRLAGHYNSLLFPFSRPAIFMEMVGRINHARREYAELLNKIREQDEGLYSLISVFPYELEDIQKALDPNTTLFVYYAGEQSLSIWVISRNGFRQERVSLSRGEVDELVSAYRNALQSREKSRADVLEEKLYNTFLKPVIPFVHGDRVGFVPHGTLYNLPFASMRYIRSYLVDGFTIFHLPHSGLLIQLKNHSMRDMAKAIILADSPCIEKQHRVSLAGEEMDALKRIFPQADYVVGQGSIRDDLSESTGSYDVIHLILKNYGKGQGLADCSSRPVTTAQCNENLDIRDVLRLRLTGRVAVLSACQTIRERYFPDTGLPILTTAWLYAVGPSVITQLWEVEDKAKAVMIESFYKNLEKSGSAADALRAAQNEMIQRGYEASDWAAFIMTGR